MLSVLYKSLFFFFKQKTAYEFRIGDWSSDVCSSDLVELQDLALGRLGLDAVVALPGDEVVVGGRHLGLRQPLREEGAQGGNELVAGGAGDGPVRPQRLAALEDLLDQQVVAALRRHRLLEALAVALRIGEAIDMIQQIGRAHV